ncbi:MAG TPA: prepilin-type N-terminal cleavage/methylation domain-containing protein [Opitutaceae bacterium]|nr:prepilin-type N-terminal cleavage/methylation domain-containing protein [Opitutaceae bacterium]
MTISTPPTERAAAAHRGAKIPSRAQKPRRDGAFTLVEVMIAATLSTFVLAGVLSAFLMIGRTGFAASGYSELEAETRRGLEIFGEDVRKAVDLHWNDTRSITLTIVTATNATGQVTYAYDVDRTSATYGCFYRVLGDATSPLPRRALIHNVADDFLFERFKLEQAGVADNHAATDPETKQLQVTLHAKRTGVTTVATNQSALSARYILRNKSVAN